MVKPSIRRRRTPSGSYAPGWDVTRPGFGFAQSDAITTYGSWELARDSLTIATGTSAALAERRNDYTPGLRNGCGRSFRPRWIEAQHREGA